MSHKPIQLQFPWCCRCGGVRETTHEFCRKCKKLYMRKWRENFRRQFGITHSQYMRKGGGNPLSYSEGK